MVPVVLFPPVTPFTAQRTAVSFDPVTVAENCEVFPGATNADVGETEMAIRGVMVTGTDTDLLGSAWLVADTRTVEGLGIANGAV
jgi:hypothetical protein